MTTESAQERANACIERDAESPENAVSEQVRASESTRVALSETGTESLAERLRVCDLTAESELNAVSEHDRINTWAREAVSLIGTESAHVRALVAVRLAESELNAVSLALRTNACPPREAVSPEKTVSVAVSDAEIGTLAGRSLCGTGNDLPNLAITPP